MVNLWIRELGDYDYNPTTIQAASLHLRTLLADKKALLVIDDVWYPEHVEPFRIGGAGCCVLVTTRQTQIVGAQEYDLALMTPEQSLELLTKYLPNPLTDVERSQAEAFAKEVGYLPLALELAAARVKKGVFWDELLTAFQKEMAIFNLERNVDAILDETTRKQRSLVASFKLTLKLLSQKQLEQLAWLGIVPEDVTLTQAMGATLWNVDAFESGEILRNFKDQALLLSQAQRPGERPTYRIHDLVHDLAKNLLTHDQYLGDLPGLGLRVKVAHSQFLERYQTQTQDGLWHTLPADGYIHSHLAWHFEQSGHPELMHQLLKESTPEGRNGWYETCDRLGQPSNFLMYVTRAWQAAETLYEQNDTESIALQCRYALITTTLNRLAQHIPPELIVAFVQKDFWQPAQGLAYVRQKQKLSKRADGLIKLIPYLSKTLMSEALTVAYSIPSEADRARALSELIPHLPEVVDEALTVARSIPSEADRARALSELIPHLPEVVNEALNMIRFIQPEVIGAKVLYKLAPHLPEDLISEALATANSIQDKPARAIALSGLVSHLPEVMCEALEIARSIQNEFKRVRALSMLTPYLPELASEALMIVHSVPSESDRCLALGDLVKCLPDELMSEALAVARSIHNKYYRTMALYVLVEYLPKELMRDTLAIACSIQDEYYWAGALRGISLYLPEVMNEILEVTCSIQDESAQIMALSELASYLPEVMSKVCEMAGSVQDEVIRVKALIRLAPYLPEELMNKALAIICSLQDEYQAKALSWIIEYLPEERMSEVLTSMRTIQDRYDRVIALSAIVEYLPEVISEALGVARAIQSESSRVQALLMVAPYMPEVASEALDVARSIQDEYPRASALGQITEYMPEVAREA